MKRLARSIIDLTLVAAVILSTAYAMGLLAGFPKGIDTYAYLTKIRLINTYFPYINWNPFWDSGTPFSIWSYPPLPMTATTFFFVKLLGFTPERALTIMAATSFVLLGWGIYCLIYQVSKSRLVALLTILVLVSSPASWSWWNGGNYVRVFGLGMMGLASFLSVRYFEARTLNKWKKGLYILTVLECGLALMSHLLFGGVTFVLLFLLFFFSNLSWQRKVLEFLRLFLPAFALAAYWYIPLFLTGKPAARFIGRDPAFPIRWNNFFSPSAGEENFSLSTSVLIFVALGLILLLIVSLLKKLKINSFQKGVVLAWFIAVLTGFLYNTIGYLPIYPETWYIIGFPPITAFSLFGITTVILGGLVWGIAVKGIRRGIGLVILMGALGGGILGISHDLPSLREAVDDVLGPRSLQSLNQQVISVSYPFNFRYGTDSAFVADWFNWRYDTYQTRDYFIQGITYPDWQNWFESAVWYWEDNYPETKFLLDWYGVREFFVGDPHFRYEKFLDRLDEFQVDNHKTLAWQPGLPPLELYQLEYPKASPILTARNTPVVLVIGKKQGYEYFLRALAQTGLDSQKVIPIRGGEIIDQFDDEELGKFDALVLYEYTYKSKVKAMTLLKTYLSMGRTILWETHGSPETKEEMLPELLPIEKISEERIWDDWGVHGGQVLKIGSKVLRKEAGIPLVVSWEKAGGKIIWSGLNLPFLILEKKTKKEVSFLENLLVEEMIGRKETVTVSFEASFPNPERREIEVSSPAKGVLLKESYFSNWHAWVDKKRVKLYRAGPDLMYIFLPEGDAGKAVLEYKISFLEKGSWLISISTFLGVLVYALEGILLPGGLTRRSLAPALNSVKRWEKKLFGWWEEEE